MNPSFPSNLRQYIDELVDVNIDAIVNYLANEFPAIAEDLLNYKDITIDTTDIDTISTLSVKLKVSENDSTPGALEEKLTGGFGLEVRKETGTDGSKYLVVDIDPIDALTLVNMADVGMIITPAIVQPAPDTIFPVPDVTFQSTAYETYGLVETHLTSDWEVALDSGFLDIVASSYNDTVNLTSWTVTGLTDELTYYVRVRHNSQNATSEWSPTLRFSIDKIGIVTPAISYPSAGLLDVSGDTEITSTSYQPSNITEPHLSTDWEIATDMAMSNLVFSSYNDTAHLVKLPPLITLGLDPSTTYYVRVRYKSNSYTSDWSLLSSFSTASIEYFSLQSLYGVQTNENFGTDVAISSDGQIAIVGSPNTDINPLTNNGRVTIYTRQATGTFSPSSQLNGSQDLENFGYSVAIDSTGAVVVVGSPGMDSATLADNGCIKVFARQTDGSYLLIQQIDGTQAGENFGTGITISSDGAIIAVESRNYDAGTLIDSGRVSIYTRQVDGTYALTQQIDGTQSGERFGFGLKLSGDGAVLAIGGYSYDTANVINAGRVSIYNQQLDGTYLLAQQIDGVQIDENLGTGIGMTTDGSVLVIGGHKFGTGGLTANGRVTIYAKQIDGSYAFQQQLEGSTDNMGFGFKPKVSDDGAILIVASYGFDSSNYSYVGRVLCYSRDADGAYNFFQQFDGGLADDKFARSVDINGNGDTLIIGAYKDDSVGLTDNGKVGIFDLRF